MSNLYIKQRSWLQIALYQFITFNIYGIFWIRNLYLDAKENDKENYFGIFWLYAFYTSVVIGALISFLSSFWLFNLIFGSQIALSQPLQFLDILKPYSNLSWIFLIILSLQSRKYLEENYGVKSNIFFTLFFTIFQLQYRINKQYDNINNNNSNSKQNELPIASSNGIGETLSASEQFARFYIRSNRSKFSKDSIRSALIGEGILSGDADTYLERYY